MSKMNLSSDTTSIETASGRTIWSAGVYTPYEISAATVVDGGTINNYGISLISNTTANGQNEYVMSGAPGKNQVLIVATAANSSDLCLVDMTSDVTVANGTTEVADRYLTFATAYASALLIPLSTAQWLAITNGTVGIQATT